MNTKHIGLASFKGYRAKLSLTLAVIISWSSGVLQALAQPTAAVTVVNPIRVATIEGLLEAILNIVIVLAIPVIVFFIIYAGFLYATARGNAEQIKQATSALTYAIIGGVIILGSVAIATIVKNLVAAF